MSNIKATPEASGIPGWSILKSDEGRYWATRRTPFGPLAEEAGAFRTVDADDMLGLASVIARHESIAEIAERRRPQPIGF